MKRKLIFLLSLLLSLQIQVFAQTNIYVTNSGSINTLEDALDYIKDNYTSSENRVTTPVNVYLIDNGVDIMVSNTSNKLVWDVSGTLSNPITITSQSCRATLTRNLDSGVMLYYESANYINISKIDFNKVTSGAIVLDNCDYCDISYCSFHGDGASVIPVKSGVIWMGVIHEYAGQNTESSSYNSITYNNFYDMNVIGETKFHQAIYVSNGAYNNIISSNYINFPPALGIVGGHGDYKNNNISTNLISRKDREDDVHLSGIYLTYECDTGYNNGAPYSITGNNCYNNYVYDSQNNYGVKINPALVSNNFQSNNHHFNELKPNDPYWLGYNADRITNRMVSGDFDRDGIEDDVAAFYDYIGETRIHVWESIGSGKAFEYSSSDGWWYGSSYSASNINKRVVSGDFDRDGYKDDIAAFYDCGGGNTRIHVWKSNGSSFSGPVTWWVVSGYDVNRISGRLISGDFDRDGYEDDIVAFYDYNGQTKAHVWRTSTNFLGRVTGFNYSGSSGWWQGASYTASNITDRVISGDFDRDGYNDDIAAFCDYGNYDTRMHVWQTNGSSFSISTWWTSNGYNANKITNRVISGDFDRDGYKDDIACFYDYGNNQTRTHVWKSTGTSFLYSGSSGWWNVSGYDGNKVSGRLVSGDFDRDGKIDDITAFYDYSSEFGSVRSHVWQSNGNMFSNINNSLGYPWLIGFSYYSKNSSNITNIDNLKSVEKQTNNKVYPNPSKDFIIFELEALPSKVTIFNSQGKVVFDETIFNNLFLLELEEYSKGVYVYLIINDNSIDKGRFVVN